jgi:serine/threonine protein kinase
MSKEDKRTAMENLLNSEPLMISSRS